MSKLWDLLIATCDWPNPKYICATVHNPLGSVIWDFPLKTQTRTLYRKHRESMGKPVADHKARLQMIYIRAYSYCRVCHIASQCFNCEWMDLGFHRSLIAICDGLRTRNIYVALNSPSGSDLWAFPFKYQTTTLYRKHGNTRENPHPTIRPDLKYYIPKFIVIGGSGISQRTLYITLGFSRLRYAIGEADSIMYVLYLIFLSGPLNHISFMARLWLPPIARCERLRTRKYIYYG